MSSMMRDMRSDATLNIALAARQVSRLVSPGRSVTYHLETSSYRMGSGHS